MAVLEGVNEKRSKPVALFPWASSKCLAKQTMWSHQKERGGAPITAADSVVIKLWCYSYQNWASAAILYRFT